MKINKKIKVLILILFLYILIFQVITRLIPLKIDKIPDSQVIFDSDGIFLSNIPIDKKYRHISLKYQDIPDFTKKVIISLEDKGFWRNNGVSYKGIGRAMINNIFTKKPIQGASTISSQIIRNTYGINKNRNIFRKLYEFYLAISLNKQYSKEYILTKYLDIVYFGYLNYGIESASYYYFEKPLKKISQAEQLSLITILKNSNKYNPLENKQNFENRYNFLLETLSQKKVINFDTYNMLKNSKLEFAEKKESYINYFLDFVSQKTNKKQIFSTFDSILTKKIKKIADNSLIELNNKNANDYGILILDKKDNSIKVMIGGKNYFDKNGQYNSVLANNQAGSTMKPFTYLLAFKLFGYEKDDIVLDLPIQFKSSFGYSYKPENFDLSYHKQTTYAQALAGSFNIPALILAKEIGINNLYDFYKKLGFDSIKKEPEFYGLALTLGVAEISLYDLTKAYSIFANEGELCGLKYYKSQKIDCKKIIENKYIEKIYDILSDRLLRINAFGVNSNFDFENRVVFLKSGTSRNFSDNRVIGITKNYIIGVWLGNKDGESMQDLPSSSGAGKIFKNIVYYLENQKQHIPKLHLNPEKKDYLKIISPLENTTFGYKKKQKIFLKFDTNMYFDDKKWFINNTPHTGDIRYTKTGDFIFQLNLYNSGQLIAQTKSKIDIK